MTLGRPREFDTQKALDEAMDIFWRHGYEGATIAELTAAMGINPPSLYSAFGSKEGLLKAALDRYAQKRDAVMHDILSEPTAHEVVKRLLLQLADLQTDAKNPPGCLLVAGGLACGAGAENVPFELAARRARTEDQLRDRFLRAKEEDDLPPHSDAAALARYLSAVIAGMGVLASSGASRDELREVALLSLTAFERKAGKTPKRKTSISSSKALAAESGNLIAQTSVRTG
ncbi:MAG TPA: TetR/AcrR family transcriptional regulator [Xanthobacteraceae bacterium]|jgi:AcrR family transcriptional regulator|nr:TetR/AcrR family transcriptional regulator [Xanthobacteraceae bacterium]